MVIHYLVFCHWLFPLTISFRFIPVVSNGRISLFFKDNNISLHIVYICISTYVKFSLLVHHHLCHFHILAAMNNAVMNTGVQMSLLDTDLSSFRYVSRVVPVDHMYFCF